MTDSDSTAKYVVNIVNHVLAAVFTVEMFLRWTGLGVAKYFSNMWTLIDFIVVLVSCDAPLQVLPSGTSILDTVVYFSYASVWSATSKAYISQGKVDQVWQDV